MEETIIGYQYGPVLGDFRCVYEFPNNLDKEEIHMPPFTTLVAPPETPDGMIACWNGTEWELKEDTVSLKVDPIPDEELGKLLPEFVADQIRFGLWSDELQQKYDIARPLYLQSQVEQGILSRADIVKNTNI